MSKLPLLAAFGLLVPVSPELPRVSWCDLAREPGQYAGQRVRTRVSYLAGPESAFLYDPGCNSEDAYAELVLDCEEPEDCAFGETAPRLELLLEGRWADWDGVGYGPGGALRFRFRAESVEVVASLPEAIPAPDQAERAPAPFMAAVHELRRLDAALCGALAVGDATALRDLTLEEFIFTEPGESFTGREHFLESFVPMCEAGPPACTTTRVHLAHGLGFSAGLMACDDGAHRRYALTHSLKDGAWRGARGQLEHSYDEAAELILAQLTAIFDHEHELRELSLEDLPAPYRWDFAEVGKTLGELGFDHLGLIEDLTVAAVYPEKPAFMSLFADAEGVTSAEAFLLAGRPVVSFMTELADGRVLVTHNSEVDVLTPPLGFEKEALPFGTALARVLARHRERQALLAAQGARSLEATSLDQVVDAKRRAFRRVSEHRRSVGYLTRREMETLTVNPEVREQVLDVLWDEFTRRVEIHRRATSGVEGS